MPKGLKRFQESKHLHYITWSCYRRQQLLRDPRVRDIFVRILEEVRRKYAFRVFGFVVMPEHVHLLISEPEWEYLYTAMQVLKHRVTCAARPFGWERESETFWQKRYFDFNVWSERKKIEKLKYIHRNPVKRGLVERPEEWRWSSYRHYAFAEFGVVEIESEWTARVREHGRLNLPKLRFAKDGTPLRWTYGEDEDDE
jgi:putative transposase